MIEMATQPSELEQQTLIEARKHIFTMDADSYSRITGRSLTDVETVLLMADSGLSYRDSFGTLDASTAALLNLYEKMQREGIEYAIGLKFEVVPKKTKLESSGYTAYGYTANRQYHGSEVQTYEAIAYATGLKRKSED